MLRLTTLGVGTSAGMIKLGGWFSNRLYLVTAQSIAMSEDFDPYREWLGIEPYEQPVHHYRLLGVTPFTHDLELIRQAADQRMNRIRQYQMGRRGSYTQPLLNAIAGAKLCLLDPARKVQYDQALMHSLGMAQPQQTLREQERPPPPALPPLPPLDEPPAEPPALEPPLGQYSAYSSMPVAERPRVMVAAAGDSGHTQGVAGEAAPPRRWRPLVGALFGLVLGALVGFGVYFLMDSPKQPASPTTSRDEIPAVAEPADPSPATAPPSATEEPVVIQQEGDGSFHFPLSAAVLSDNLQLQTSQTTEQIVGWQTTGDRAAWEFEVTLPGRFFVLLEYSSQQERGGLSVIVPGFIEKRRELTSAQESSVRDGFWEHIGRGGKHRLEVVSDKVTPETELKLMRVELRPQGP